jgi:hypothetical protein
MIWLGAAQLVLGGFLLGVALMLALHALHVLAL